MSDALQTYLDTAREAPFVWGEHDCALFAARSVDALRGSAFVDTVRRFNCRSAKDYRRMQREGATLRALATAELGEPMTAGVLQRGDVVLVNAGRGDTLGIAVPPVVLVAAEPGGYIPLPLESVKLAWRVL